MLALVDAIEMGGNYGELGMTAKVDLRSPSEGKGRNGKEDFHLLQLVNSVSKNLPDNVSNEYYILIDDLDLHWHGTDLQNAFLGAMFLSIRKLSRSKNIKFVVSLRKNIYRKVHIEERDKFSDLVCEVSWQPSQVRDMVTRRICHVLRASTQQVWGSLFPPNGFEMLWNSTNGVPREVIRLAVECVRAAQKNENKAISLDDVEEGTMQFSTARLDDLVSLHHQEYPGLLVVLQQFKGGEKHFDSGYLQDVAYRASEPLLDQSSTQGCQWVFGSTDDPLVLGRILLGMGFLLLKDGRTARPRVPDEDEITGLKPAAWYAVHPMYAKGLGLVGE